MRQRAEAKFAEWFAEADANFCLTAEYCSRVLAALSAASAAEAAASPSIDKPEGGLEWGSWGAARSALGTSARSSVLASAAESGSDDTDAAKQAETLAEEAETQVQLAIFRDIFGDLLTGLTTTAAWLPFKDEPPAGRRPPARPLSVDPAWLTWHDGLVVSMAQRMYDTQDFTDMPVLADAQRGWLH